MTSAKSGTEGALGSSVRTDRGVVALVQGLEVVLLRLAGTALGAVAKSLLTPGRGAALVPDRVRSKDLAKALGGRLASGPYADLPEHEQLAAADSVRDGFARAGEIDAERLFAVDLLPERLAEELRSPDAGLSPRAVELYDELLALCCAHLIEQATSQPWFAARAAVEHARVAGRTRDAVEELTERTGRRPEAAALDFEERYARYVAATHGRLGLFGLTLGRSAGEWELETAYISLGVSGERTGPERFGPTGDAEQGAVSVTVKVEQAVADADRLLLRGPAGSGKSTLVQWLAVNAARRTFGPELSDWNRCVPFVLRLRAFASSDEPPLPEDFLRTTGVPLSAPEGWAEKLLSEGRALVLVDGVDEVPVRLRQRTREWLKRLIAAYPMARYVVTTRPSAVPEDWLERQGFSAHTLLPMEREDVRAFIAHWHDAARRESPAEGALLDTYEQSLRRAVSSRRDLGRLATNPLMCALLCALNRDRRMQLPRARKELYDAALDMLLVRRDTEREICGVEGVGLTREEQTALLQRLAYWLIRNGRSEAAQDDAAAMVTQWLAAMPQVRGKPEQVFSHLLIRSGLLREPAPGSVHFVHRTFQDYLGAKAAVEERDFGFLVRNAHDDQWDDVIQMSVGHARVSEREQLLTALLERAEREEEHRHRLVLLAAACLEHAPELGPEVWTAVQERTRELLPPRSIDHAEYLAKVGELVPPLLPGPGEVADEYSAGAVVRTAALIGGDAAFDVVVQYRDDERLQVANELSQAWDSFETEPYLHEILARRVWHTPSLSVKKAEQLAALRHLPLTRGVHLQGDFADLAPLGVLPDLDRVFLYMNRSLTDLAPLTLTPSLRKVGLSYCPGVRDLSPLAELPLTELSICEIDPAVSVEPLRDMTSLTEFALLHPLFIDSLTELPLTSRLATLELYRQARYVSLDGIEQWPALTSLLLCSPTQFRQLVRMERVPALTHLRLLHQSTPELSALLRFPFLTHLTLLFSDLPGGLAPLRELPSLRTLSINNVPSGHVDLTPLKGLPDLVINVSDDTEITGAGLFAEGRLNITRSRA